MNKIEGLANHILEICDLSNVYSIDIDNLITELDIKIEYGEYDYSSKYENGILYLNTSLDRIGKGVALGYALLYPSMTYYSRYGLTTITSKCRNFSYCLLMSKELYFSLYKECKIDDKLDLNKIAKIFDVTIEQALYRGRCLGVFEWM